MVWDEQIGIEVELALDLNHLCHVETDLTACESQPNSHLDPDDDLHPDPIPQPHPHPNPTLTLTLLTMALAAIPTDFIVIAENLPKSARNLTRGGEVRGGAKVPVGEHRAEQKAGEGERIEKVDGSLAAYKQSRKSFD